MEATRKKKSQMGLGIALLTSAVCGVALASQNEANYEATLSIASQKLERLRAFNETREAGARLEKASRLLQLPPAAILSTFGRSYRKGESWLVASWRVDPGTARMTSDPTKLDERLYGGTLLRFEIVEDRLAGAVVRVTCEEAPGLPCADPKMKEIRLHLDARGAVTRKVLYFKENKPPVELSPDGIRGKGLTSPLEAYALEIPELWSAGKLRPTFKPKIPKQALSAVARAGAHPAAAGPSAPLPRDAMWLQQDDAFGRPVHVLWADRELWPRYLRSATSVSLLIRRDS